MTYAEIITIGDEILIGQITDTNSQWIAEQLALLGVTTQRMLTIGDTKEKIVDALNHLLPTTDLVFITGGLGPTKDDITKHTLSSYFNTELVINKQRLEELTAYYAQRGKELNALNKTQALLPKDCLIIPNEVGTASGMWFSKEKLHVLSMPGVPFEMKKMMEDTILPKIKSSFPVTHTIHRTIKTIGIPESNLAIQLSDWEESLPDEIKLAYLPSMGMVKLRLSASHTDETYIQSLIKRQATLLYNLIGDVIYGEGQDLIEQVVGNLLKSQNKSIATAESCTGGYLAHLLTSIAGSSAYYKGSVIAYSNDIKMNELSVQESTLHNYGAVSEETVKEMAQNIRKRYRTTVGLACSGIAGPDGGTPEKPVGTVWIAYADEHKTISKLLHLTTIRSNNIRITALYLLELLRKELVR